jgi:hypothetical protein
MVPEPYALAGKGLDLRAVHQRRRRFEFRVAGAGRSHEVGHHKDLGREIDLAQGPGFNRLRRAVSGRGWPM